MRRIPVTLRFGVLPAEGSSAPEETGGGSDGRLLRVQSAGQQAFLLSPSP